MTDDSKTIKFPEEGINVDLAKDLPQGASDFYNSIQRATVSAFQVAQPFQNQHPALDQALNETLRYLELATMYMDRYVLYVKNPQVLGTKKEKDANDGEGT